MIRTFRQHEIRKTEELTGSGWSFRPLAGEHFGRTYKVVTPSCWESIPDLASYRGAGEYTKTFTAAGNVRLEFKGVGHFAEVYFDGSKIAEHYNAYTAFEAVVRDLPCGEHTLTVRADNSFSEKSALHFPNDYMSYGGIIRPIALDLIGELYIRYVHVTPYREDGKWKAQVDVCVRNICDCNKTMDIEILIADNRIVTENALIPDSSEATFTSTMTFEDVREWSPESPELYTVTVKLLTDGEPVDDLIDRFGFRAVKVEGKDILLNGRKMRILGVCRHEDHPQFGAALPFEAMAADMTLIKDLGANAVRTSHYPNDERFLDLCDEEGIIVWEENHARGLSEEQMRNENFEPQAERVISEMVELHYNHPSICIWGILNECASQTEYGRECYKKQLALLRELDSSRPHSYASCMFKSDICFDLPDIVSYNIYPLWYHDTPPEEYLAELYDWVQNETGGRGKPFLITEIGAGAIYGYRAPHHDKWTEEYQAEALEKQLSAVLGHKDCSGVFIWQFCDIRVSKEWFAGRPRTMNNKGLVDEYRRPKLGYYTVKDIFGKERESR